MLGRNLNQNDLTCTEGLKNRGRAYSDLGDYDTAIQCYSRAIQLNPKDVEAYMLRGSASSALGYHHAAIYRDYGVVIDLDPKYPWAYLGKGDACYAIGDYLLAIQSYSRAIGIDSMDPVTYRKRGDAHYALENYRLAIDDYDTVINLDPSSAEAYRKREKACGKLSPAAKSVVVTVI